MKIRYTGDDASRDLAVAGGVIVCPRMKWVDVTKEAQASGIAEGHAEVVAREVVKLPDWELESVVKAVRTRARNQAEQQQAEPVQEEPEASEPPVNEEQA